jgi:uroporphyrin-III C-methyltransferase
MFHSTVKPGVVHLVGAGPGSPDLLTLRAARLIMNARIVVHDRLVSPEIMELIPASAELYDVGKAAGLHTLPQPEINALLVRLAQRGVDVVRLKGGDPFIFGRGSEEAEALAEVGVRCEITPGITSAQGCAAAALVPLTHRGVANSVRYITGHCKADEPLTFDWQGLADPHTTLVVYMGLATIGIMATQLMAHGLPGRTPTLAICQGTTPQERRLRAPLSELAVRARSAGFSGPVLFIIGDVVAVGETLQPGRGDHASAHADALLTA